MSLSERQSRWLKFGLALGISLFFSFLFLRSIDLDEVLDALADANYIYVFPALALFALSLVFRSLRWRYLLLTQVDRSWQQLISPLLVGYAGNNLLPARAGELLRVQHLADHHAVPRMYAFGTLMMERLFDGFVLASFVLWGLLLADAGTAYLAVGLALAGLTTVGFVVGIILARNPAIAWRFASWPVPFLSSRLKELISELGQSFFRGFSVLTSRDRFVAAALTSAIAWGLELGMYWLISLAFDLDASFITIAFAGAAANVAMSLPAAQGGIGPFQYFATEALLTFGILESQAAAYSLALHIFLVGPVSLVGLIVLWRSALSTSSRTPTSARSTIEIEK